MFFIVHMCTLQHVNIPLIIHVTTLLTSPLSQLLYYNYSRLKHGSVTMPNEVYDIPPSMPTGDHQPWSLPPSTPHIYPLNELY